MYNIIERIEKSSRGDTYTGCSGAVRCKRFRDRLSDGTLSTYTRVYRRESGTRRRANGGHETTKAKTMVRRVNRGDQAAGRKPVANRGGSVNTAFGGGSADVIRN